MASRAATSYRGLLRASKITFANDTELLKAAPIRIRQEFEKNKAAKGNKLEKLFRDAKAVEEQLVNNLAKVRWSPERGRNELLIEKRHEVNDYTSAGC